MKQTKNTAPDKHASKGSKNYKKTEKNTTNHKSKVSKNSYGKKPAKRNYKKPETPKLPVKIIPLGGLGEIGKNITLYEYDGDMFLVDCGMSFPDEEMPGIDIVIPDFTYILENKDKIKGLVVTHGHEDHIGAIPYLLKEFNLPIYATRLTIGLIEGKLKEHRLLGDAKLNIVKPGETISLGKFNIEFINVNHSIPDAVAFAINSPAGTVIHTGDFKIDTTPIDGNVIDLARFGEYGKKGVLALLADSTNAERPGFTSSESLVGGSLSHFFNQAEGHRIIIATFSSNIHRIQQIINEAVKCDRKVAFSGRSMNNVVTVASELGYLNLPENVLIDVSDINSYPPEKIVLVTTGSQGETMSALHRIAFSDHRQIEIISGDIIIISATPIPGNEKLVSKVINELMKRGANVVYEKMYDVHVSGHACQEELKLMMSIIKPQYFMPVHGEQKHLMRHSNLAEQVGINPDNIIISQNGDVVELSRKEVKCTQTVQAGRVLVDGLGVGDVGSIVLRDRKLLSDDGIIIIAIAVDRLTREIISGPDVVTRGFIYVRESEELIRDINEQAADILERCYIHNVRDWNTVKTKLKEGISRFLFQRTKRSPMVLPIIMEVNI